MNSFSDSSDAVSELPFLAGIDSAGELVFESIEVELLDASTQELRLLKSPLLARNLAAGDRVKLINAARAEYELLQRSGNLCIRVFCAHQLEKLAEQLTPKLEKLDGVLDRQTDRALVYSIHYSIGFQTIEAVLNGVCEAYPDTVWYYGNVYDPEDGSTPLQWWLEIDNQK